MPLHGGVQVTVRGQRGLGLGSHGVAEVLLDAVVQASRGLAIGRGRGWRSRCGATNVNALSLHGTDSIYSGHGHGSVSHQDVEVVEKQEDG
jgi:hypothetical protein